MDKFVRFPHMEIERLQRPIDSGSKVDGISIAHCLILFAVLPPRNCLKHQRKVPRRVLVLFAGSLANQPTKREELPQNKSLLREGVESTSQTPVSSIPLNGHRFLLIYFVAVLFTGGSLASIHLSYCLLSINLLRRNDSRVSRLSA